MLKHSVSLFCAFFSCHFTLRVSPGPSFGGSCFEQGIVLDDLNVESVNSTALTYALNQRAQKNRLMTVPQMRGLYRPWALCACLRRGNVGSSLWMICNELHARYSGICFKLHRIRLFCWAVPPTVVSGMGIFGICRCHRVLGFWTDAMQGSARDARLHAHSLARSFCRGCEASVPRISRATTSLSPRGGRTGPKKLKKANSKSRGQPTHKFATPSSSRLPASSTKLTRRRGSYSHERQNTLGSETCRLCHLKVIGCGARGGSAPKDGPPGGGGGGTRLTPSRSSPGVVGGGFSIAPATH